MRVGLSDAGTGLEVVDRLSSTVMLAVNLDGADPHYAASLRKLGAVQAPPMSSSSAIFNATASNGKHGPDVDPRTNPAVQILTARERLAAEAEKEFAGAAKSEQTQRRFLEIGTLQQVLAMRDDGRASPAEIERKFGLQQGVVESLGTTGVVGVIRSS